MAIPGCDLKESPINNAYHSDDELWSAINNLFSTRARFTTSYKFCFFKSILDNIYNVNENLELSMVDIFARFTEIYWNLIVKHHLNQIRKGRALITKLIEETKERNMACPEMPFERLTQVERDRLIAGAVRYCSTNVVGALCADFRFIVYGFDKQKTHIKFNYFAYMFLLKYAYIIVKLNYFEWIKFLESVNDKEVAYDIAGCLDDSSQRTDLSRYRKLLLEDLHNHRCFYCGCELNNSCEVDHFIPWSFVKDDKAWNFVQACKNCNGSKKDKLAGPQYMGGIITRNKEILRMPLLVESFKADFDGYRDERLPEMYKSAAFNGFEVGWEPKVSNYSYEGRI